MKPSHIITYQNNDLQRRLRLILAHDLGHKIARLPRFRVPSSSLLSPRTDTETASLRRDWIDGDVITIHMIDPANP
jgi:hypothetical protein